MIRPTEVQRKQWDAEGYLVLEDAIAGEELMRLQVAFDRCAAADKPAWLEGIATGVRPAAHFDIPNPLVDDEVFIDLVDHPSWYGLLMDFAEEDLIFLAPQVRTLPVSPVSYVGWHPDVPHTTPLHMKVQIYVEDVSVDGGAFAYVPGSHKPDVSCPHVQRLDEMPGHQVFPGKAGTAILFNSYGWHTSMINRTQRPRKSIILIYEKWSEGRIGPDQFAGIADSLHTRERRVLFGLER
ncbi:MAG: phytanoyl-CoA dioxygenase family protein [bacterium]|nr:phytanoyl-CoA dioxygenase family protein [bacterium]